MTTQALRSVATGKPTTEMSPKQQVAHLLQSKQHEIAKVLPKHLNAERLLKIAQVAATTTPGLLECEVPSLIGAIGQCAQMGLEPNTVLGHAYLTPFNAKVKDANGRERWVKRVQVIIGYKGLIDLARRSGQIVSIAAHEVREKDHFELEYGLQEKLSHRPALTARGELTGFYAVAQLKGGGHAFEFMPVEDVRAIMKKSQSKGEYGPWKDHFVEMGRKTVIRRLAKYLPLSVEFQTAAALDEMADAGRDQNLAENTIDGDFAFVPESVDPETGEISGGAPALQAPQDPALDLAELSKRIAGCKDVAVLEIVADDVRSLPDGEDKQRLMGEIEARDKALAGKG